VVAAQRPSARPLALGWALAFALAAGGFLLGGELGRFALAGLGALPLAMLAVLAYLGTRRTWARVLTLVWLSLIVLGLLVVVVTLSMTSLGLVPGSGPARPTSGATSQVLQVAVGVFAIGLFGAMLLLRPVRRFAARFLPIDPSSFVQAVALAAVVTIGLIGVLPLLVLGGPPVVGLEEAGRDRAGQMRDQVYGLLWVLPCAVAAVGYGVSRTFPGALARLGLVRPTGRIVLVGLAAAVALLGVSWAVDTAIGAVWTAAGWPRTDTEAFEKLIAFAFTPLGALVLGVTAGLGEEVAVRGVLQPRMGILMSNLFFVALHGLQYNWDALLSVFIGGLLLGLLRKRTNTTTAAVAHGSYDFFAVLASLLGFQ
jgi:membrane protease YdiL (CAAX protease family)